MLAGDDVMVSGAPGQWGLRFDANRNDLAAVTTRYASEVADVDATLVLFTTFDDHGTGGPAYYVPLLADTPGTGQLMLDQRAEFGVQTLSGFVNMRRLDDHGDGLLDVLLHEVAHRHLAYLSARSSTVSLDLTGRQGAHWHAALSVGQSLMGGYDWRELAPGRFEAGAGPRSFTPLDRYALGLLDATALPPVFFIADATTEGGARIPPAAQLQPGAIVLGRRVDIDVDAIVAEVGPRALERAPMHVVLSLLTEPGESTSSTRATQLADRIDALRSDLESSWTQHAGGELCTQIDGCASRVADAGVVDAGARPPADESCGCAQASLRAGGRDTSALARGAPWLLLLLWGGMRGLRRRGRRGARAPTGF